MKSRVFIIGLGLIGGSLGLALRDNPLVESVMGFDADQETGEKAVKTGVIDRYVTLADGARQGDCIFICTPLGAYDAILETIRPCLKAGTIVSDVGSTKLQVMEMFKGLPPGVLAIGGHPMAGAETRGIASADRYLFENAVYVLTPASDVSRVELERLEQILASTGARIEHMDAALHDELVATVSHLPHLAAVALVGMTEGRREELMLAAGGFRDTTRVASSNPDLWEDIVFFNREPLLRQLKALAGRIKDLHDALEKNDRGYFRERLNSAKTIRDSIPHIRKGLIPSCYDLVCIVPDRPGVIGQLGLILDEQDINIVDIEILRVREGDGGTIRLGVSSNEKAEQAVRALQTRGIKAWLR